MKRAESVQHWARWADRSALRAASITMVKSSARRSRSETRTSRLSLPSKSTVRPQRVPSSVRRLGGHRPFWQPTPTISPIVNGECLGTILFFYDLRAELTVGRNSTLVKGKCEKPGARAAVGRKRLTGKTDPTRVYHVIFWSLMATACGLPLRLDLTTQFDNELGNDAVKSVRLFRSPQWQERNRSDRNIGRNADLFSVRVLWECPRLHANRY
jgi:hypothetical protein